MLRIENRGAIRWLIIDNPQRRNAIPADGWSALVEAFEDFDRSDQRVLVISGEGSDFCSGADLAMEGPDGGLSPSAAVNARRMRVTGRAASLLHRLGKPTIAAVDGVAVGAGMNLALGCDIVIATDRARFSEIFVRRGLTLDFGGTWLLPRLVGMAKAKEIALTGRMVEAAEAEAIGLVSRVVAPEQLVPVVTEIAETLATGAPLAQRFIKTGLSRSWSMSFEDDIGYEDQAQAIALSSADATEGVAAFIEKRSPEFKGR